MTVQFQDPFFKSALSLQTDMDDAIVLLYVLSQGRELKPVCLEELVQTAKRGEMSDWRKREPMVYVTFVANQVFVQTQAAHAEIVGKEIEKLKEVKESPLKGKHVVVKELTDEESERLNQQVTTLFQEILDKETENKEEKRERAASKESARLAFRHEGRTSVAMRYTEVSPGQEIVHRFKLMMGKIILVAVTQANEERRKQDKIAEKRRLAKEVVEDDIARFELNSSIVKEGVVKNDTQQFPL